MTEMAWLVTLQIYLWIINSTIKNWPVRQEHPSKVRWIRRYLQNNCYLCTEIIAVNQVKNLHSAQESKKVQQQLLWHFRSTIVVYNLYVGILKTWYEFFKVKITSNNCMQNMLFSCMLFSFLLHNITLNCSTLNNSTMKIHGNKRIATGIYSNCLVSC